MKFRKRPIVIEAEHFLPADDTELPVGVFFHDTHPSPHTVEWRGQKLKMLKFNWM